MSKPTQDILHTLSEPIRQKTGHPGSTWRKMRYVGRGETWTTQNVQFLDVPCFAPFHMSKILMRGREGHAVFFHLAWALNWLAEVVGERETHREMVASHDWQNTRRKKTVIRSAPICEVVVGAPDRVSRKIRRISLTYCKVLPSICRVQCRYGDTGKNDLALRAIYSPVKCLQV